MGVTHDIIDSQGDGRGKAHHLPQAGKAAGLMKGYKKMKGTEKQIKEAMENLDMIKADIKVRIANDVNSAAGLKADGYDLRAARELEDVDELKSLLDAVEQIESSDADAGAVARCLLSVFHLDSELCDCDVGKLIEKMKNPRYGSSY